MNHSNNHYSPLWKKTRHYLFPAFASLIAFVIYGCSPQSALKVDYLASAVAQNPEYFDGSWNGFLNCGPIGSYPAYSHFYSFSIENGTSTTESGLPSRNGYRKETITITPTGKVRIRGSYFWDNYKSIYFSGQVGYEPDDPSREEVLLFSGMRGPRSCSGSLSRFGTNAYRVVPESEAKASQKSIEITSHHTDRPNITIEADTVVQGFIEGSDSRTTVTVQDKAANLKEDGAFSITVNLNKGLNQLIINVSDQENQPVVKSITINRIEDNNNVASPVITITSFHKNRNVLRSQFSQTIVAGTVSDEKGISRVRVNGLNADIDPNGWFTRSISLLTGKNQIVIEAINTEGTTATRSIVMDYLKLSPAMETESVILESTSEQALAPSRDPREFTKEQKTNWHVWALSTAGVSALMAVYSANEYNKKVDEIREGDEDKKREAEKLKDTYQAFDIITISALLWEGYLLLFTGDDEDQNRSTFKFEPNIRYSDSITHYSTSLSFTWNW